MRKALIFATAAVLISAIQQFAAAAPVETDVVLKCVYPGQLHIGEKSFDMKFMVAIRGKTATVSAPLFAPGPRGPLDVEETPSHFVVKLKGQGGSMIIDRIDGSLVDMTEGASPMFGSCTPVDQKF